MKTKFFLLIDFDLFFFLKPCQLLGSDITVHCTGLGNMMRLQGLMWMNYVRGGKFRNRVFSTAQTLS